LDFLISLLKAFLVGGFICMIAQILIDKTALTPARILVLYVSLGVALTALGVYGPLVSFAGCGATTPLLGFGYSLAEGVRKAVDERGLIGALTGGLTGAAGGIAAATVFAYIFALIFRGHPKK
jgi:stage V sporulation protein AE